MANRKIVCAIYKRSISVPEHRVLRDAIDEAAADGSETLIVRSDGRLMARIIPAIAAGCEDPDCTAEDSAEPSVEDRADQACFRLLEISEIMLSGASADVKEMAVNHVIKKARATISLGDAYRRYDQDCPRDNSHTRASCGYDCGTPGELASLLISDLQAF